MRPNTQRDIHRDEINNSARLALIFWSVILMVDFDSRKWTPNKPRLQKIQVNFSLQRTSYNCSVPSNPFIWLFSSWPPIKNLNETNSTPQNAVVNKKTLFIRINQLVFEALATDCTFCWAHFWDLFSLLYIENLIH